MATIKLAEPVHFFANITELMAENWAETGFDFELNPSLDVYQAAVKAGVMFALVATNNAGEIVGYCTTAITNHPFNPAVIVAANDALFVKKEYRGILSARLIVAAEKEAKARGASRFLWHTRAGTDFSSMLLRRGYTPADVVVMKEI